MTNVQLYLAIGIPVVVNAGMFAMLLLYINARFSAVDARFTAAENSVNTRFDAMDRRFDAIDRRFDDMRDLWRSELHRVEEVLDARLKHLEQN